MDPVKANTLPASLSSVANVSSSRETSFQIITVGIARENTVDEFLPGSETQ